LFQTELEKERQHNEELNQEKNSISESCEKLKATIQEMVYSQQNGEPNDTCYISELEKVKLQLELTSTELEKARQKLQEVEKELDEKRNESANYREITNMDEKRRPARRGRKPKSNPPF